jgi:hypothetical protein
VAAAQHPTALISYSHDSPQHEQRVLELCNRLRARGVDSGVGRGVVWEARILRNLLYEDAERHSRIVPILLDAEARAFVPTVFRGSFL